jgi:hypothetical protein
MAPTVIAAQLEALTGAGDDFVARTYELAEAWVAAGVYPENPGQLLGSRLISSSWGRQNEPGPVRQPAARLLALALRNRRRLERAPNPLAKTAIAKVLRTRA